MTRIWSHRRVRRTLEAGLFVVYARPFVDTRSGRFPRLEKASGLNDELMLAHRWALSQRSEVYAHTGDPRYRPVIGLDVDDWLETLAGDDVFVEAGSRLIQTSSRRSTSSPACTARTST